MARFDKISPQGLAEAHGASVLEMPNLLRDDAIVSRRNSSWIEEREVPVGVVRVRGSEIGPIEKIC